jgi:hypothetical protein
MILKCRSLTNLFIERSNRMEAKLSHPGTMSDDELNEALEVHRAEEFDGLSLQNQRLAIIQEYEEAALLRADPFAAVIGMGNAYLQRIFEHLGAAVLDELDTRAPGIAELRELVPEIRLLTKLRNAIQTDLAFQATNTGPPAAACPSGMKGNRRALEARGDVAYTSRLGMNRKVQKTK